MEKTDKDIKYTDASKIWKGDNNIYYIEYLPNAHITIDVDKRENEILKLLRGQSKIYVLVDSSKAKYMDREARIFLQNEEFYNYINAAAMISNTGIGKIIINFVQRVIPPRFSQKAFNNIKEAEEWLINQQ